MKHTIRRMVKEDIDKVQDVAKESWHATYEGIIPGVVQDNFLKAAYSDEMLEARLKASHIFVAEIDGGVAGFANFTPVDKEGQSELSAIYLYPAYQGKGFGSALLKEGIRNLEHLKRIYIDVEKENVIGMNFYKAKGFSINKEFDDDFDGHILKTVRMVLEL